jgi:hypothetical protein
MDINSLPNVPQHQIDAMMRSKKKIAGLPSPDEMNEPLRESFAEPSRKEPDMVETTQPEQELDPSMQNSNAIAENTGTEVEIAPEAPVRPTSSDNETNIRTLRKKALEADRHQRESEKFQRERDEYAAKLKQYEYNYAQNTQQNQAQEQEDDSLGIGNDDLVEGKHLSKVEKRIKDLTKQVKNYQEQAILSSVEARLKANYHDFDKVVSAENLETLKLIEPELSAALNAAPDLYIKAVSAYKLIKRHVEPLVEEEERNTEEKAKIRNNLAKPRLSPIAPSTQGDSALSKAHLYSDGKVTKDLQQQHWKEMQEAKKNY